MFTSITAPLINGVRWPSSRRSTWKQAINSGWRFIILVVHPRICMTTVPTLPISRVSCWRRKLGRHFEALWGSTSSATRTRKQSRKHVDADIWGREFQGGREENSFDCNSFRAGISLQKFVKGCNYTYWIHTPNFKFVYAKL